VVRTLAFTATMLLVYAAHAGAQPVLTDVATDVARLLVVHCMDSGPRVIHQVDDARREDAIGLLCSKLSGQTIADDYGNCHARPLAWAEGASSCSTTDTAEFVLVSRTIPFNDTPRRAASLSCATTDDSCDPVASMSSGALAPVTPVTDLELMAKIARKSGRRRLHW
jgi:hypothetical protein